MIQDIPERLDNSYKKLSPEKSDNLIVFDEKGRAAVRIKDREICFTKADEITFSGAVYLFSIGEEKYFLSIDECDNAPDGYEYKTVRELRDLTGGKNLFAAFTAYHLWKWYSDNKFCGKCGHKLIFHDTERALCCENCGNIIYPRINPAVIVGVIKDDEILITRYQRGYAHNALVAGFTEIGETLEQTVEREVMEETGISVKNIRYYRSQPWGMAQDILVGFFCDYAGGELKIDTDELKIAEWVQRENLVFQPNNLSLTNDMMKKFKYGQI